MSTVYSGPIGTPSIESRTTPDEGASESISISPCSSKRVPAIVMVSPAIPLPDIVAISITVGASMITLVESVLLERPVVPARPENVAERSMKPMLSLSSTVKV